MNRIPTSGRYNSFGVNVLHLKTESMNTVVSKPWEIQQSLYSYQPRHNQTKYSTIILKYFINEDIFYLETCEVVIKLQQIAQGKPGFGTQQHG